MKKTLKYNFILLLTAIIWGFAFVAQRVGMDYVGAFTFSGVRFILGSVALIPVIGIFERNRRESIRYTVKGGAISGVVLCAATNFQQFGIALSKSAAKSGFLTGIYIILVPIIGVLLFRKKTHWNVWLGAVLGIIGLFLISFFDTFSIDPGDLLVIISGICFAFQILAVDKFSPGARPVMFSAVQFAVAGIISLVLAFIFETPTTEAIYSAGIPILYGGLMSVGVAYTLQVIGQRGAEPTAASIIMSTESVFAVVGGVLILHERLSLLAIIGSVLLFSGIIISQLEFKKK